ncbi:flagellar hook-associated protein 1 FlgK [Alkalibacillus flavidus]|uniref:Flagellar hook-associated protein 1 n=1 Tax=Alkalibacillus flavidus TaxID=546021 RepID=A0ABV2KTT7_9BACI
MSTTSTFHGLEVARRALATQQTALHTTSHNISNANTEGYSRQRVNFEQTNPFPPASRNRPEMAGQLGTGVKAGQIQRVRDEFLDFQYRAENNKAGQYAARSDALGRLEEIMNEPSDSGLAKTMDQFWESIQDVATNPEDGGARRVMVQRAEAVTDTFHYLDGKLKDVQGELKNQLNTGATQVNSLIREIENLNDQIGRVEPNGDVPNDLYDKRDLAIDELSEYVNIKIEPDQDIGGNPSALAQGIPSIHLADENGNAIPGAELINSNNDVKGIEFEFSGTNDSLVENINIGNLNNANDEEGDDPTAIKSVTNTIAADSFNSTGSLRGTMEANGYVDENGDPAGDYVEMIDDLSLMADEFVSAFNDQHQKGHGLDGSTGQDFFTLDTTLGDGAAAQISVAPTIKNNENAIAASDTAGESGNGDNALLLSDVRDEELVDLNNQSIQSFYQAQIGDLGVKAQEANRMANNTSSLRESVDQNRQSVSGVSLDEEMSNMIKFQHAYNAAARSMTVVDETLNRIINQMGIVGR